MMPIKNPAYTEKKPELFDGVKKVANATGGIITNGVSPMKTTGSALRIPLIPSILPVARMNNTIYNN